MITSKENSARIKKSNYTVKLLVQEFYNLRKAFEVEYSGKLRCHKYEETRDFTIALNYGIFQANRLDIDKANVTNSLDELFNMLEMIKQDYQTLIA